MADGPSALFDLLGLSEYERTALTELLTLGRTTAPNLAEAAGIPKARVYGVLDSLADRGFVEVIPAAPRSTSRSRQRRFWTVLPRTGARSSSSSAGTSRRYARRFSRSFSPATNGHTRKSRRPRNCFPSSTSESPASPR